MVYLFVGWGELCLQTDLSVGWGKLCLQIGLSVRWLGVMFAIGFICLLVGGYVIIISLTLGMVSVLNFFCYKFKPIPWILSYKWADYWPYLSFIIFYVAFCCYVYYHGLFVSCKGWCGCSAFFVVVVISICTELLCFGRGI